MLMKNFFQKQKVLQILGLNKTTITKGTNLKMILEGFMIIKNIVELIMIKINILEIIKRQKIIRMNNKGAFLEKKRFNFYIFLNFLECCQFF